MHRRLRELLSKLRGAKSVEEGDAIARQLAEAARENVDAIVDLYREDRDHAGAIVSSLHGLTDPRVIDLYQEALENVDPYVRWSAVEGLK